MAMRCILKRNNRSPTTALLERLLLGAARGPNSHYFRVIYPAREGAESRDVFECHGWGDFASHGMLEHVANAHEEAHPELHRTNVKVLPVVGLSYSIHIPHAKAGPTWSRLLS